MFYQSVKDNNYYFIKNISWINRARAWPKPMLSSCIYMKDINRILCCCHRSLLNCPTACL